MKKEQNRAAQLRKTAKLQKTRAAVKAMWVEVEAFRAKRAAIADFKAKNNM